MEKLTLRQGVKEFLTQLKDNSEISNYLPSSFDNIGIVPIFPLYYLITTEQIQAFMSAYYIWEYLHYLYTPNYQTTEEVQTILISVPKHIKKLFTSEMYDNIRQLEDITTIDMWIAFYEMNISQSIEKNIDPLILEKVKNRMSGNNNDFITSIFIHYVYNAVYRDIYLETIGSLWNVFPSRYVHHTTLPQRFPHPLWTRFSIQVYNSIDNDTKKYMLFGKNIINKLEEQELLNVSRYILFSDERYNDTVYHLIDYTNQIIQASIITKFEELNNILENFTINLTGIFKNLCHEFTKDTYKNICLKNITHIIPKINLYLVMFAMLQKYNLYNIYFQLPVVLENDIAYLEELLSEVDNIEYLYRIQQQDMQNMDIKELQNTKTYLLLGYIYMLPALFKPLRDYFPVINQLVHPILYTKVNGEVKLTKTLISMLFNNQANKEENDIE